MFDYVDSMLNGNCVENRRKRNFPFYNHHLLPHSHRNEIEWIRLNIIVELPPPAPSHSPERREERGTAEDAWTSVEFSINNSPIKNEIPILALQLQLDYKSIKSFRETEQKAQHKCIYNHVLCSSLVLCWRSDPAGPRRARRRDETTKGIPTILIWIFLINFSSFFLVFYC